MIAVPLLALALADPLPVAPGVEPPPPHEAPELAPIERVALRDDRYQLGLGVSVNAGAYLLERGWVAAATFGLDLHADFGRWSVIFSPHVTVLVDRHVEGLVGFEGQVMVPLNDVFAVAAGTEQLLAFSRYQTGVFRIGPSLRPIIMRSGKHRVSLQVAWLPLAFSQQPASQGCGAECTQPPLPYYTLGYGVVF